ncbi:myb family transcription factor PHL11-like [Pyrus x bretschneideri]|uniref:myb family transcription factor PHL11-like n=1 Tax=Pyrus x bretschneideri TaxID=225117 RepID=UPI00202E8199|nr:myb family transcription factor PHL11-like [Pyrus x bretschneideri]
MGFADKESPVLGGREDAQDSKSHLKEAHDIQSQIKSAMLSCEREREATPKSVLSLLTLMGLKGLTSYHLKSHLQKYRLRQHARKQNSIEEQTRKNNGDSYVHFSNLHSTSSGITSSGGAKTEQGTIPLSEALKCQIEVQNRLQEQLVVQKKLQMRIEAQEKYLQAILEKAQKGLTLDVKGSHNIEATRAQLTDFNLALSNFLENMSEQDRRGNTAEIMNDAYKNNGSTFQIYEHGIREENKDTKLKVEGGSIHFDFNSKGSYDYVGPNGGEFETRSFRLQDTTTL